MTRLSYSQVDVNVVTAIRAPSHRPRPPGLDQAAEGVVSRGVVELAALCPAAAQACSITRTSRVPNSARAASPCLVICCDATTRRDLAQEGPGLPPPYPPRQRRERTGSITIERSRTLVLGAPPPW